MAIPQAGRSYNRQQTPVRTGGLNLSGLGQGLKNAAATMETARAVQDNASAQLSKSQTEYATWMIEDWSGQFLRHMDNPEKLKSFFQGTPFESVMAGIPDGFDLMDSSNAQTVFFHALNQAGTMIDDEDVRNNWNIAMRRQWEKLEVEYLNQADAWRQTEARNTEFQNLDRIWNNGYSTDSIEYNAKQDYMLSTGMYGADPAKAYETMQEVRTNHRKMEHTALLSEAFRQEYMPFARENISEEEMNIIFNGVESMLLGTQHMGEEEFAQFQENFLKNVDNLTEPQKRQMTSVLEAIATSGFSLTREEIDDIREEYITMANNYSSLYNNKVEEGRQVYYDNKTAQVLDILNNPDYTEGQRLQMAQNMINGLRYEINRQLPGYETGMEDIPMVELGFTDAKKTEDLIKRLSTFVSDAGDKIEDPEGQMIMQSILSQGGFSKNQKIEYINDLFIQGRISGTQQQSAMNKIDSFTEDRDYQDAQKRVTQAALNEELSPEQLYMLRTGIDDIWENSGAMHPKDVLVAADNFIDGFLDQEGNGPALVSAYQSADIEFWNHWIQDPVLGRSKLQTTEYRTMFQEHVEAGRMAGWISSDPQMFAEYASATALAFTESYTKDAMDYLDLSNVVMNPTRNEPVVIGHLVDPWGNALIVAPVVESEQIPAGAGIPGAGQIKVRVFQPSTVQSWTGRTKETVFTELTDSPNGYFLTATDADGRELDVVGLMDQTGGIPMGYNMSLFDYTGVNYTGTDGRLTYLMREISIDPNFEMERQRVY